MKKVFLAVLFFSAFSTFLKAQKDDRHFVFAIAPQINMPIGDFRTTNKIGLGGSFNGDLMVAKRLNAIFNVGGIQYHGKTYAESGVEYDYAAVSSLTLKGGLKYFITKGLFAAGDVGLSHLVQRGEVSNGIAYAPRLGYDFEVLDINLRYEGNNQKTLTGQKIQAYGFSLHYHF